MKPLCTVKKKIVGLFKRIYTGGFYTMHTSNTNYRSKDFAVKS